VIATAVMIAPHTVRVVVVVLGMLVVGVILLAAAYDLSLEGRNESLGLHLARWARRYPLFAIALIALLGAMLGHFFTHLPPPPG
jgi:hypothetical protein